MCLCLYVDVYICACVHKFECMHCLYITFLGFLCIYLCRNMYVLMLWEALFLYMKYGSGLFNVVSLVGTKHLYL